MLGQLIWYGGMDGHYRRYPRMDWQMGLAMCHPLSATARGFYIKGLLAARLDKDNLLSTTPHTAAESTEKDSWAVLVAGSPE